MSDIPFYLKDDKFVWPEDQKMFYLLTRDGLFICRNHPWFQSIARAKSGPSNLQEQKAEVSLSYPRLPRALVEKAVGFFLRIYEQHHWEAAVLIIYNRQTQQVELLCPEQDCSFGSVNYKIPTDLPHHLVLLGDFHSHCNFSPTPSGTDEADEMHRPGIHLIIGNLKGGWGEEKKKGGEFHCEVVVDSTRFVVNDLSLVMEAYHQPDSEFPQEWLAKVKEKKYTYSYGGYDSGYGGYDPDRKPGENDKKIIKRILDDFLSHPTPPTYDEVERRLLRETSTQTSWSYCKKKAEKFMKHWPQLKKAYDRKQPTAP